MIAYAGALRLARDERDDLSFTTSTRTDLPRVTHKGCGAEGVVTIETKAPAHRRAPPGFTSEQRAHFNREGYLVLGDALSQAEVDDYWQRSIAWRRLIPSIPKGSSSDRRTWSSAIER